MLAYTPERIQALAGELDAARGRRDYAAAFQLADRAIQEILTGPALPESACELAALQLAAARRASMMAELAGAALVDEDGRQSAWAVPAERRDEAVEQILGHYQLALAASGRLLASADTAAAVALRPGLAKELAALHDDFLAWDGKAGPGGEAMPALPIGLVQVLFSQEWGIAEWGGAEDLLFLARDLAADDAGAQAELRDMARRFYDYLEGLNDETLERGGLPRAELPAARAELGI